MAKRRSSKKSEMDIELMKEFFDTERTVLSNERTLLSFIRTALSLIVAGISFVQFVQNSYWVQFLGWFFIICGIETFAVGVALYSKVKQQIFRDQQVAKNFGHYQYDLDD